MGEDIKSTIKKTMKKVGKALLKSTFFKIVIIVLLVVFIILPSFVYFILKEEGDFDEDDWKSTPYAASNYTREAQITENGVKTKKTSKEVWDEMVDNDNNVKHYLDTPEELEKLMNAEIITQYPKTGATGEGVIDGIIEFHRITSSNDGSTSNEITLEYISLETFNSYLDNKNEEILNYFSVEGENVVYVTIDTETEELETNDSETNLSEYTTNLNDSNLESEGKYKKVTKSFSKQSLYYKQNVQKYTMPFDYLWTLLVLTEDKELVLELAELVNNSEIIISIYDNITTTVDINTDTYKKEIRTDTYAKVKSESRNNYGVTASYPTERWWVADNNEHYNASYPADYNIDETEYKVTHTITREKNTPTVDLTRANVWILDYKKTYEHQVENTEQGEDNSVEVPQEEFSTEPNLIKNSDEDESLLSNAHALELREDYRVFLQEKVDELIKKQRQEAKKKAEEEVQQQASNPDRPAVSVDPETIANEIQDIEVVVNVDYVECKDYIRKTNRIKASNAQETKRNYVGTTPETTPKLDKNSDENNFVKILCNGKHEKAREFLTKESSSWFFEMLQSNQNTQNMVNMTKFLFNKVTDSTDFTNEEFNFSEFTSQSYNFISTGASGQLSLTTTIFEKDVFIKALQAYYDKTQNQNFNNNFLAKAAELYDTAVASNVNPELVVITAKVEGNFKESGGKYNYWGLNVPNGASSGDSFNSFEEGVRGYANYINKYTTGEFAEKIKARYEERKAAGCDPLGYGLPGTLSGMQSLYSFLGKHEYGSSGKGGYYYMDPARAGVTKIYATHEEFLEKCYNVDGEHAEGTVTTVWEQGQYTAWQVESKLNTWNRIFGDFGSLDGNSQSEIPVANGTAQEKLSYLFPSGIPTTEADCSKYIVSAEVALTGKDGTKKTGTINIHKNLVKDVQEVFQIAQNAGFKIYEAAGYSYRDMNNGGSGKLSHHSYGVAIDINVNENYSRKGSTVYAGSFWNPSTSEFSIPTDGVLVKAFEAKGWKWGGKWSGNYQDYMHFSFTGN